MGIFTQYIIYITSYNRTLYLLMQISCFRKHLNKWCSRQWRSIQKRREEEGGYEPCYTPQMLNYLDIYPRLEYQVSLYGYNKLTFPHIDICQHAISKHTHKRYG
jgi:hypothetical protein